MNPQDHENISKPTKQINVISSHNLINSYDDSIKNICECNCDCKNKNNYDYMCLAPSYSKKVICTENGVMIIKTISHCKHFASCELSRTSCNVLNNISHNISDNKSFDNSDVALKVNNENLNINIL